MFDFDVVTGPGDRAKPTQSDARRKPAPPSAAAPPAAMSGEPEKDASVETVDRAPFE
jgi:hypothetical protein